MSRILRISCLLLILLLCLQCIPAQAATVQWEFDSATGTLIFRGSGAIAGLDQQKDLPWKALSDRVTTIIIEDGITHIGMGAFSYFYHLKELQLPQSLRSIGNSAFYFCNSLSAVELPSALEQLDAGAFAYTLISDVTIPASLTTMLDAPFFGCPNLHTITVASGNTAFCTDEQGLLYTADMKALIQAPTAYKGSCNIPHGVTEIRFAAFQECKNLTELHFPFTIWQVSGQAFQECTSLHTLYLPASVKTLDLIYGCPALKTVYYGATETDWQQIVERSRNDLSGLTVIYDPALACSHTFEHWKPAEDSHTTTCTVCGHVITDAHEFPDFWTVNARRHMKECLLCGQVSEVASHSWPETWEQDASGHYRLCTVCQSGGQSQDHSFTKPKLVRWPLLFRTGRQEQTCTVCGYLHAVEVPPLKTLRIVLFCIAGAAALAAAAVFTVRFIKKKQSKKENSQS